MGENKDSNGKQRTLTLPTPNQEEELLVSGRMVTMRAKSVSSAAAHASGPLKHSGPASKHGQHLDEVHTHPPLPSMEAKLLGFPITKSMGGPAKRTDLQQAPELLTLEEVARRSMEGLDHAEVLNRLTEMGPAGRLLLCYRNGKLVRHEIFEDPRVCKDIERGGVIYNLEQKPADMSGWRVHEFYIDSKGCLGELCFRCARVCPESAIHLRGQGASSFCEIDQAACKGCYICWVECTRKASDCILVDGKVFDSQLRARHFGE